MVNIVTPTDPLPTTGPCSSPTRLAANISAGGVSGSGALYAFGSSVSRWTARTRRHLLRQRRDRQHQRPLQYLRQDNRRKQSHYRPCGEHGGKLERQRQRELFHRRELLWRCRYGTNRHMKHQWRQPRPRQCQTFSWATPTAAATSARSTYPPARSQSAAAVEFDIGGISTANDNSVGVVNISGGLLSIPPAAPTPPGGNNAITMAYGTNSSATINLNGGVLATGRSFILGSGTAATLNLNGGTLQGTATNANWFQGVAVVAGSGGAIIDTQGKPSPFRRRHPSTGPAV